MDRDDCLQEFIDKYCLGEHDIKTIFKKGNTQEVTTELCNEYNKYYGRLHPLGTKTFNILMTKKNFTLKKSAKGKTFSWIMSKTGFLMHKELKNGKDLNKNRPNIAEINFDSRDYKRKRLNAIRYLEISGKLYSEMIKKGTFKKILNISGTIDFEKTRVDSIRAHYEHLKETRNKPDINRLEVALYNYKVHTRGVSNDRYLFYSTKKDTDEKKGERRYTYITSDYQILDQPTDQYDIIHTISNINGCEDDLNLILMICRKIRNNSLMYDRLKENCLNSKYTISAGWQPIIKNNEIKPINFNEPFDPDADLDKLEMDEATDEILVTKEPTDEIFVTKEPTDEILVTKEPTDEILVTKEPTDENLDLFGKKIQDVHQSNNQFETDNEVQKTEQAILQMDTSETKISNDKAPNTIKNIDDSVENQKSAKVQSPGYLFKILDARNQRPEIFENTKTNNPPSRFIPDCLKYSVPKKSKCNTHKAESLKRNPKRIHSKSVSNN